MYFREKGYFCKHNTKFCDMRRPFLFLIIVAFAFVSCHKSVAIDDSTVEKHLFFSDDTIVFDGNETKILKVWADKPFYGVDVWGKPDWIAICFDDSIYMVEANEVISMSVSSNMEGMPLQECHGTIVFNSDIGSASVVVVGMPDEQLRYELPDSVYFPSPVDETSIVLKNTGNVPFHYEVNTLPGVSVNPARGDCQVEEIRELLVSVDRDALPSNQSSFEMEIRLNDVAQTVVLEVERKQYLTVDVVDAEYSKATDELVYVASDATLNVYCPDTKKTDVIELFYKPTCVSVSPDGTKALVGYDAHVSYVDLVSRQVLTTNDVCYWVHDAVVTSQGMAYVVPKNEQFAYLHCMDVTVDNSEDCLGCRINAGLRIKLDVSEDFIYGADNGIHPSSIEKYDIRNIVPQSMFCVEGEPRGDLWMSESGDRIFSKGRTVYGASNQNLEIIGKIPVEGANYATECYWIEHLERTKSLYLVAKLNYSGENEPFVFVHDSDGLQLKDKIRLEKYMSLNATNDVTYQEAEPHFVFANTNGEEVYVLTNAVNSDMSHSWAIQTFKNE